MIKNKKPTIFLFSPFIHPEPISTGKYNTYLVEALVRKGCSVEVVASHPIHPDWRPKRTAQVLDGVKIYRGGGFFPYPKSMILRQIRLEVGFALHTIRHSLFKRNIDIVIPVFPPSLFFFLISLVLPQTAKKIGIVHDIQGVMASLSKSPFQKK